MRISDLDCLSLQNEVWFDFLVYCESNSRTKSHFTIFIMKSGYSKITSLWGHKSYQLSLDVSLYLNVLDG